LNDPNGPLPGFEPPGERPASYPGQLPGYEQAQYPSYQQAPYPGYPAMSGVGAAPPVRRPASVELAFRLLLFGALIVAGILVLAVVIGNDDIERSAREELAKDGPFTESDVAAFKVGVIFAFSVPVAVPMTLIVIFAFVMRRGRNWARITLTVLISLGLLAALITAIAPAYLPVRLLAVALFPINLAIIIAMFQASANQYFDPRARMGGWTTA